ncbi:Htur_1727 family rSAM-partnered candidate RiPP [Halopenitus persicus]|uniref:Htur_1727 family rSAM-partnered candidate RiPP n=1 Tax=Halopenitus persicus TaxID=1048396 RepID=UPI001E32D013|nr:Htur_1727 family rSAM-partnered candidate RiPP [Halopenitus persicus]
MADDETPMDDAPIEDERPASIETATRTAEAAPRATTERRWEVFVREDADEPMTHVGTITAPSPEVAHEEASTLFAWYARDLWVCPSDETYRYSSETLGSEYEDQETSDEVAGDASEGGSRAGTRSEPRVYEETEGTPNVRFGGKERGKNLASQATNGGDRE